MPIYEYQCSQCSHSFEKIQSAAEKDAKVVCPKCGSTKSQRIVSAFSCGTSRNSSSEASAGSCGSKPGRFS